MTTLVQARPEQQESGDEGVLGVLEEGVERLLFASRWLLAPLYVGLVGGLICILVKFGQEFWDLVSTVWGDNNSVMTLGILKLLDTTLLANLVLIVVFAGYETFVSKIGAAEGSEDRPHWMGHVDYSGLKMKLIASIVAISVIGLLNDFLTVTNSGAGVTKWHIFIHLTFLVSGVLFSVMDYIAEKRVGIRVDLPHDH